MNFDDIQNKIHNVANTVVNKLKNDDWERDFIRNLDDYAPTLSYLGFQDFVNEKIIHILNNSKYIFNGIYLSKNLPITASWENDEWLGGLLFMQKSLSSNLIKNTINSFLENFSDAFLRDHKLCSFSLLLKGKWVPIPSFNPWSGATLEVLLNLNDYWGIKLDSDYKINLELIINKCFENQYFKMRGVFPTITFFENLSHLNLISDYLKIPLPKFYYINQIFPSRKVYEPAKPNSSMLHALNTGCRVINSNFLKRNLIKFINGISKNFVNKAGFVGKLSDNNVRQRDHFKLSVNHPIIESLCDTYYFHLNKQYLLDIAEKIANAWINVKLPTNLFPKYSNCDYSWLDDQIDIAICFGRLYELTGKEKYLEIAKETIKAVFDKHYHFSKSGLVEEVDKKGNITNSTIHPKFNALAIKGWIFLKEIVLEGKKIYENMEVSEILKDR